MTGFFRGFGWQIDTASLTPDKPPWH